MKQTNATQKAIGENTFYIRPFGAFTAANISAELVSLLSPVIGVIAPVLNALPEETEEGKTASFDIMNMDAEKVVAAATPSLSRLSGDKLEVMMKRLMIDYGTVSIEGDITDGKAMRLTEDLANEVFCGEIQDMFLLCFEIIKVNYNGFFKKLGGQFGLQKVLPLKAEKKTSADTESST